MRPLPHISDPRRRVEHFRRASGCGRSYFARYCGFAGVSVRPITRTRGTAGSFADLLPDVRFETNPPRAPSVSTDLRKVEDQYRRPRCCGFPFPYPPLLRAATTFPPNLWNKVGARKKLRKLPEKQRRRQCFRGDAVARSLRSRARPSAGCTWRGISEDASSSTRGNPRAR